jgi:hypothetical protein
MVSAESHSAYSSSGAATRAEAGAERVATPPLLGGSSSARASSAAGAAIGSGFWLYAKPIRVIPSLVMGPAAESGVARSAVALLYTHAGKSYATHDVGRR